MVRVDITGGGSGFRPGETLQGTVTWAGSGVAQVEVQLSWLTEGKGTQDTKIVERVKLGNVGAGAPAPFSIKLPESPYSFSGKLISLIWGIEAVTDRSARSDRLRLMISPTGREILLHPAR